ERQLRRRETECLARDVFRHAFHLVQHLPGLHQAHPVLDVALALALAHLERLLGHRLVREHPDPDLAAALDVTRHRTPAGLDLPCRQAAAIERLQSVFTERDVAAAMRETAVAALHLLAIFRSLGL